MENVNEKVNVEIETSESVEKIAEVEYATNGNQVKLSCKLIEYEVMEREENETYVNTFEFENEARSYAKEHNCSEMYRVEKEYFKLDI